MCFFQRTSWPEAIAHLDCNSFFASVEEAYNPKYKGKPVMVGGINAGCVITANYIARSRGVKTGMPVFEAKKICTDGIFLNGDFKKYLTYHNLIKNIISQYTPTIEDSSIDEFFFDLKGLRRLYRKNYSEICFEIKEKIKEKLGITVSIGLSLNKTLSKIASDFKKPDGLTVVSGKQIEDFLKKIELSDIPGIGHNTLSFLNKHSIFTPLQYLKLSESKIKSMLGKNGLALYMELRGYKFNQLNQNPAPPKSLARTRSFAVTNNYDFIYSEIIQNLSLSFWELRRKKLKTQKIILMLRLKNYQTVGAEIHLEDAINCEKEITPIIQRHLEKIFNQQQLYRSTGIINLNLSADNQIQQSIFENPHQSSQTLSLFEKLDQINEKYGIQTISLASSNKSKRKRFQLQNLTTPFLGQTTN